MSDYFETRDEKNFAKIDSLLAELPEYVGYFITGISHRTSMLTRLNYATDLRLFFYYLSKYKFSAAGLENISLNDLDSLTAFDIEKFANYLSSYKYNGRRLSCGEKAKERKLSTLRSFYKYLYKKDFVKNNIMLKVEMPKLHDSPIVKLEINEVIKLLDAAEDGNNLSQRQKAYNKMTSLRDTAILSVFLGTGIRVSELVGLNIDDFDFDNNAFNITRKGGNKSILYLPDETIVALANYISWRNEKIIEIETADGHLVLDKDVLFYSMRGGLISGQRLTVRAVENLVKKYSRIAAPLKKITPHKLRSTYATNLYKETGDIYVVADVLGHSDINTTKKHYAEMTEENKRRAAKVTVLRKEPENEKK